MSMINTKDILETIKMIEEEHLDIRTITMGISLRDLAADDINVLANKVYDKVTRRAEKLVATGEQIERELGIPIINKRISVTPIAMVGATSSANSYVPLAKALDRAAEDIRAGRGTVVPEILRSPKFKGYRYPHDYENDYFRQEYLPEDLRGRKYYEFGTNKTEQAAKAYWDNVKSKPDRKKSPGK